MLLRFIRWLNEESTPRVENWFRIEFDEATVQAHAKPPGRKAWSQSFAWSTVERVCFKDEGGFESDGLYIFTSLRPESFVIPVEAKGGEAFFQELVSRGLFPAELMKEAALSTNGAYYCWPKDNEPTDA